MCARAYKERYLLSSVGAGLQAIRYTNNITMETRILHIVIWTFSVVNAFVGPASKRVIPIRDVAEITLPLQSSTSLNLFERFWGNAQSAKPPQEISEGQVRSLFYRWNEVLASGDANLVAKQYAENPVLLPTISDIARTDFKSIKAYYEEFLRLKPQGTIKSGKFLIGHNWAMDAGVYVLTMGGTGAKLKARFTFIYVFEKGQWKIAHHHSSPMPEGLDPKIIDDDEIRSLFYKWNDALDTLNSTIVANRHGKSAILFPSASDEVRTNITSINEYYDVFLKLKPQAVIRDSFVFRGDRYCFDVGTYEFTFGATGDKVNARYTFVYVYEDDEWKIMHHHSSVMPGDVTAKFIGEAEAKELFRSWNDALATLSPGVVTNRYAKNAMLIQNDSDSPHMSPESIQSYYESFLKTKPQCKAIKSSVSGGYNWCADVGTFECTTDADGSTSICDYSFMYTMEDGEWKILQNHLSFMPTVVQQNEVVAADVS